MQRWRSEPVVTKGDCGSSFHLLAEFVSEYTSSALGHNAVLELRTFIPRFVRGCRAHDAAVVHFGLFLWRICGRERMPRDRRKKP
jgi:hypothetical protein